MILDKEIKVKKNSNNVQYYTNLKYDVDADLNFLVRVEDLPKSSHASITVKCDLCGNEKIITYYSYRRNVENSEFNIYTCIKCSKIKSKKTNLNKYGTEYPIQNEIIKSKRKSNNIKKYGVDEPSKIKEVIDKIKVSKKLKYGDETYNNLEKNKNTKLKRYNNANYNNRLKSEATCIEKYEFKNVSMSDSIKEKKKLTFLKNFGVDNYSKSTSFQNQRIEYLKKLYQDIKIISVKDDNLLLKCDCNLNHSYEININILRNRILYKTILCSICNPINSYNSSGGEIQLQNFIKENYQGNIICNNRNIIHPYELDVYLPELKIAFEYNGLYWHSEVNKDSNFHLNKTIECSKKDIQLIHIFEDDWYYKENIIKSIILNFLKKSNKIYAKKCNVKEVTDIRIVSDFLNNNNLYGFVSASINIGLYLDDVLLSIMSLETHNDEEYYILKFCNKLNTTVVGGASKLFKYFLRKYKPKKVYSKCDRNWSNGNLLKILGFDLLYKSRPQFYYIEKNIRKKYYTKDQIKLKRKNHRIYDCGYLKYYFTIKQKAT